MTAVLYYKNKIVPVIK